MVPHRLDPRQDIKTSVGVRVDPKLIVSGRVLELSQVELVQAIETEIAENPALEMLGEEELITDEDVLRVVAPCELVPGSAERECVRSMPPEEQGHTDWLDLVRAQPDQYSSILSQMQLELRAELRHCAEYLVGSLDDNGYLELTREEIALDCGCSLEEADEAMQALKRCTPAGVGAADLQECLMLQLRRPDEPAALIAKRMVRDHWDLVVSRRIRDIAKRLGIDEEWIVQGFAYIATLKPYPLETPSTSHVSAAPIRPDLVLELEESGWRISTRGPSAQTLTISRSYLQALQDSNRDTRRHAAEMVERAQGFMQALEHREKMLIRIGKKLIEELGGFVATGQYQFLQPFTRAKLAELLEVHESSISRATHGKFVRIHTGEVLPFEVFFRPALRVQKLIQEILEAENPGRPFSDSQIAELLKEKGVIVARRTVNKYRDQRKLLSSRHRRMA